MAEKIKFYYNPMSRGRIVHWMLEEVEADYEIKPMKWETGDHKSAEYLKINPMGKIPAIEHKGIVVTECAAICAYLADVYPKANMAPALSDPERGTYYRWLFFAASCIEPAMLDKTNPRTNDPKSAFMGHGSYEDVVATMEKAVANGFLVPGKFTAADVYFASQIDWCIFSKTLESKPVFINYLNLCKDRPGYRRHLEQAGPIA